MTESQRQFENDLRRMVERHCQESDLTIGEAFAVLMLQALDLRDLVNRDRDTPQDGDELHEGGRIDLGDEEPE